MPFWASWSLCMQGCWLLPHSLCFDCVHVLCSLWCSDFVSEVLCVGSCLFCGALHGWEQLLLRFIFAWRVWLRLTYSWSFFFSFFLFVNFMRERWGEDWFYYVESFFLSGDVLVLLPMLFVDLECMWLEDGNNHALLIWINWIMNDCWVV